MCRMGRKAIRKKNALAGILLSVGEATRRFIDTTCQQIHAGKPLPAEVLEQGFRFACLSDASDAFGILLEVLDASLSGSRIVCPHCLVTMRPDGKRKKHVVTLLGKVHVRRAVFTCPSCQKRIYPLDQYLNTEGTEYTQCVQSVVTRTASWESFGTSSEWLYECAGIEVPAKSVERISETNGKRFGAYMAEQAERAKEEPLVGCTTGLETLYIEMDGTGVPMRKEDLEGCAGKQEDGSAKTREFKLGAIFTQSTVDEHGVAVRDPSSTTYAGGILDCKTFGERLSGEAIRRGQLTSERVVVLADGAAWIWNVAADHFPNAIEIVDLYHALEHVETFCQGLEVAKGDPLQPAEKREWKQSLEISGVYFLTEAGDAIDALEATKRDAVEETLKYFHKHKHRMWYGRYRAQGLFVGSGVIEGGCKRVIAQRFKKSGMRWSIDGAGAIAALRIAEHSGSYHEVWDATRHDPHRVMN